MVCGCGLASWRRADSSQPLSEVVIIMAFIISIHKAQCYDAVEKQPVPFVPVAGLWEISLTHIIQQLESTQTAVRGSYQ